MARTPRQARPLIAARRNRAVELALAGVDRVTIGRQLSAWPEHHPDGSPVVDLGYGWQKLRAGAAEPPSDEVLAASVSQDVRRSLDARMRELRASTDEYRTVHKARLERLLAGSWRAAIGGDPAAVLNCLRILDRLGRLNGVTPAGPARPPEPVEDHELDAAAAELVSAMEAALNRSLGPAPAEPRVP